MDNQHRSIQGYRELSQSEVDAINRIKEKAEEVGSLLEEIRSVENIEADPRWLSIGKTQLQQGFMAIVRSVAKPSTF